MNNDDPHWHLRVCDTRQVTQLEHERTHLLRQLCPVLCSTIKFTVLVSGELLHPRPSYMAGTTVSAASDVVYLPEEDHILHSQPLQLMAFCFFKSYCCSVAFDLSRNKWKKREEGKKGGCGEGEGGRGEEEVYPSE